MNVTITASKTDWESPEYSLSIDGVSYDFRYEASRLLTSVDWEEGAGIFASYSEAEFSRGDTHVWVHFGSPWEPGDYANPASEIARRVALVHDAFAEARESYERSYTVTI